ncbi:MAG: metallophosphoesterase [Thermodesulfobacteriota bacterium]
MFGTVLIAIFTALLGYVLLRASSVPLLSRRIPGKGFLALYLGLWLVFFLGRTLGHDGTGIAAECIETAGMTLLGSVLLCATALFFVDLATCFGLLFSRWKGRLRGLGLAAGLVLSLIALVQAARPPAVVSYDVVLPGLPQNLDGTVLAAVSDTHVSIRTPESWLLKRLDRIRDLKPDILVFLGDIFEGHSSGPESVPALEGLSPRLGKWYVLGNHEFHSPERISDPLRKAGFRRLADQWAEAAPGLILAGVDDLTTRRRRNLPGDPLGRALAGRPPGATVLLSHTPWETERAARAGVGLMLSGHTHGGQIWPFGYLVRLRYPLMAGRYEVMGMPVIMSRGLGTWGPPMRLWRRGEIVKVTLHAPGKEVSDGVR